MGMDKDGAVDGSGWSGFDDAEQLRLAGALIDECSGFTGLGPALVGRRPMAADVQAIGFEPGFVVFPRAALRDLPAGVAGRLGLALMGAATKLGKPAATPFPVAPREAHPGGGARAGGHGSPGSGDAWEAWDDAMEGQGAARPAPQRRPERPARPALEEGEGDDSLDSLVTALEDGGFGDPRTAEIIKANRAKAKSKSKRRP